MEMIVVNQTTIVGGSNDEELVELDHLCEQLVGVSLSVHDVDDIGIANSRADLLDACPPPRGLFVRIHERFGPAPARARSAIAGEHLCIQQAVRDTAADS